MKCDNEERKRRGNVPQLPAGTNEALRMNLCAERRSSGPAMRGPHMRRLHVQTRIDSFTRPRGCGLLVAHPWPVLWHGHLVPRSPGRCAANATMTITAINVRNQFRGTVREIIEGPVVSEVDVETPSGLIVTSVITTRSVKELGLVVGKPVVALVKSTEVSIATL